MVIKSIKLFAAAAAVALTGAASAGTADFTMVNGVYDASLLDISLSVQESSVDGYDFDFVVTNNSSVGSVTGVYFELGWASLLEGAGLSTGSATLGPGTLSPNIADWSGSMESHEVGATRVRVSAGPRGYKDYYYDNVGDGIAAGDSQVFSFLSDLGVTLNDLEAALAAAGYNIGVRVQGHTSDQYAEGWGLAGTMELTQQVLVPLTDPADNDSSVPIVPTPTAALGALALLGVAGLRRRRS